jgi:hypothetical protein
MWLFSRHGTRYPRNDPEPGGEDFRADQGREMELDALTQQMPILRDAVIQNHLSGRGESAKSTRLDHRHPARVGRETDGAFRQRGNERHRPTLHGPFARLTRPLLKRQRLHGILY